MINELATAAKIANGEMVKVNQAILDKTEHQDSSTKE
jgi:hypothetical protein